MRLLLSLVVFGVIVGGIFNTSIAAEEGHHEGTEAHEKDPGVPQPVYDLSKGKLPGLVKLLEPKALSTVTGTSVTLKWQPVEHAEVYHVQVAKDPRYKWLVTENYDVKGESFELSGLEAGHQYFWRVAARNPSHDAGWTKGAFTASSFETK